jgi:hypothetical protein
MEQLGRHWVTVRLQLDTGWSPKRRYHWEEKHMQPPESVKEGHDPLAVFEEWSRGSNNPKMNGLMS